LGIVIRTEFARFLSGGDTALMVVINMGMTYEALVATRTHMLVLHPPGVSQIVRISNSIPTRHNILNGDNRPRGLITIEMVRKIRKRDLIGR